MADQSYLEEDERSLHFKDIVSACLGRWWWFVLSVIFFMGCATFYLLRTPKVYTRTAALQIKESAKGRSISGRGSFGDLGFLSEATDVNNEVIAFSSPSLIQEVVKRLHLDYQYSLDGSFHRNTIYGKTLPISIDINGISDYEAASLTATLTPDEKVILSNFAGRDAGIDSNQPIEAALNTTVRTPLGKITVKKSPYYKKANQNTKINVDRIPVQSALGITTGSLSVNLAEDETSVIRLTYNDVNTQRAEEVLNTIIVVYNERWIEDKNQVAISTSRFIGERLQVIEGELGHVDENISSFKSSTLTPDVDASSNMYMAQRQKTELNINELNTQLYMARQIRGYVSDHSKQSQLLPANLGIDNSIIEGLIADYNSAMLQRNSLLANSSSANPLVKDMDMTLSSKRSTILQAIDNQINTINAQMRTQQAAQSQSTSKLASNPGQTKFLLSVERQQKVKESLYLYLLQKREENELSQAFTAYNTRLISQPMGSNSPTAPNSKKILIVAFVLGLVLPMVVIYLIEANDSLVRNRQDLNGMRTPFIGEIPQHVHQHMRGRFGFKIKKVDETKQVRELVVKSSSRNITNEAFRVTRTNLEFLCANIKNPIVLVTSLMAGSGKTFVSTNLSATFAIKNKKVVVLDLDLRKASFSNIVGNPASGISQYLAGMTDDWKSLVLPMSEEQDNLYVLPAGTIPPNPAELLFSPRFEQLLNELKKEYDMIFFDCPPVEIVADTSIIAHWADATVFVIRAGLLDRNMLPLIETYYKDKKYPNIGILLNGTRTKSGRYGYGYGYGYGAYSYSAE